MAGTLGGFAQSPKLGLNFASTDPDEATSALLPEDAAGVVPQANWNNLTGSTGAAATGLVYDQNGTAIPSTARVNWSSPNTWRSGGNNQFLAPDAQLLSGYLDTGNTVETGLSIIVENLDAALVSEGYDVYVYFVSDSTADRGGAYTIDPGTGPVVKFGSTMATPSEFVEDPGTDSDLSQDGNYLRFVGLTGTSFTLTTDTTLTTPNGFRAPVNAIQIVPTTPFGPEFTTQPRHATVYAGRSVSFSAAANGFPAVTSLRWQKDGVNVEDSARISGATTATLEIREVAAADVGNYTLVATSSRGSQSSDAAVLAIAALDGSDYEAATLAAGLVASWRLNDAANTDLAFEYAGGRTGIYEPTVQHGSEVAGPQAPAFPGFAGGNSAAALDGFGYVTVPTPPLNTNAVTLVTWIHPTGPQADFTGLFMTRSGTQAGLGYTTDNQLGYTWNNNSTWSWNSGLRPPDSQWSMVALVIEPGRATLYLGAEGAISVAINLIAHTAEAWGGPARIGDDQGGANRGFWGSLDEVAVFNRSLSFQEVATLYEEATGIPQEIPPTISPQPQSTTRYAGADVVFRSGAAGTEVTLQWQRGGVNLTDGDRISGVTTDTLTIQDVTAADQGNYTLVASSVAGNSISDVAVLTVQQPPHAYVTEVLALEPWSYYRLNETDDPSGGTPVPVVDLWGGRNGTYGVAALTSTEGPRPASGYGVFETDNTGLQSTLNLADSWATVPGPGVTTDTLTILAWIRPVSRVANAGIVFARAGQPATALNLSGVGDLGYHWLDAAATYNFASGLTPPLDQWSLAALVVEPTQATLHLINASGARSAVNTVAHAPRAFTDNLRLGGDPNNANRTFDGTIDEVALFPQALTAAELQALYQTAVGAISPTIVGQPTAQEVFPGVTATFAVAASGTAPLTYQWQKQTGANFVDLTDGGNLSGATTATLTFGQVSAADAGNYRALVSNTQGSATSELAALIVLTAPPQPGEGTFGAAVLSAGATAYYRLNETGDPTGGTLQVYDYAGTHHGRYGEAALNGAQGVAGPRPADGFAPFEPQNTALQPTLGLADSWVTVPGPGFTTDTLTILAWINPTFLVSNAGIVFARAGLPATGLNLNGAGNLGYHWLDGAATYGWDSGLTPPLDSWSLVALVVEPTQVTIHMVRPEGTQTAVNAATHAARSFTDTLRIGGDPTNVNRTFDGVIDEVAIFNWALSVSDVESIYAGEAISGPVELVITQEENGQVTLSWQGTGTLQTTTSLDDPAADWQTVPTTGNSLTVVPEDPVRFYRLVP